MDGIGYHLIYPLQTAQYALQVLLTSYNCIMIYVYFNYNKILVTYSFYLFINNNRQRTSTQQIIFIAYILFDDIISFFLHNSCCSIILTVLPKLMLLLLLLSIRYLDDNFFSFGSMHLYFSFYFSCWYCFFCHKFCVLLFMILGHTRGSCSPRMTRWPHLKLFKFHVQTSFRITSIRTFIMSIFLVFCWSLIDFRKKTRNLLPRSRDKTRSNQTHKQIDYIYIYGSIWHICTYSCTLRNTYIV